MPRPKGPGVPAHLLVESESERLSYFRQYVIAHPRLKQVDAALSRAIREPAGAALVFVYGPTGVGKTALRRHVEVRLREERRPDQAEHHLPVAGVDAVAPDSGNFAWGDFYRRTLRELERSFLPPAETPIGIFRDRFGEIVYASHVRQHELRQALEQSLRRRRPWALLIDEGSLAATLAEKSQTITLKRLQEYALSAAQREQIALEMIEGERYFADEDESSRRLMGLLGLQQEAVARDSQPTTGKALQRVGERKPQRDKIG